MIHKRKYKNKMTVNTVCSYFSQLYGEQEEVSSQGEKVTCPKCLKILKGGKHE